MHDANRQFGQCPEFEGARKDRFSGSIRRTVSGRRPICTALRASQAAVAGGRLLEEVLEDSSVLMRCNAVLALTGPDSAPLRGDDFWTSDALIALE
jgi:hypothetical protein